MTKGSKVLVFFSKDILFRQNLQTVDSMGIINSSTKWLWLTLYT